MEEADLKLYTLWYSPYSMSVVWALKLKGIAFENIEEDRFNKSPQLLEYNPVYKKAPVLVHGGKPICESMIILQYIDELWPHNPLVPHDPYQRTQARFWANYAHQMFVAVVVPLFYIYSADDEEKKKAIEKVQEQLKVVEDQCFSDEKNFFGGDTINMVDLAFGSVLKFIEALEEFNDLKVIEPGKFHHLHSWFNDFKDVQVIKENLNPNDQMVAYFKVVKEKV